MNTETIGNSELVPLNSNSRSYFLREVNDRFAATMTDCRVREVYRVQNLDLWHKYQAYVFFIYLKTMSYDVMASLSFAFHKKSFGSENKLICHS